MTVEEVKEYISSGVLELYVLGDMSAEEKLQVEAMAHKHAEVMAELREIEATMENYADVNAVSPSAATRDRVLNSLLTNLGDDRNLKSSRSQSLTAKVAAMPHTTARRSVNFYKYAFAACLLLLCVSVAALVVVYQRLRTTNDQLLTATLYNQKVVRQVSMMDSELSMYRDTSFRFIRLKGVNKTPASSLTLAWNTSDHKVMVDLANAKLPETDKDHQYQLWAIAAGKPVDLGVFDGALPDSAVVRAMRSIVEAQAFAVTIEPRGGSVDPTMDNMVVMAAL